METFMHLFFLTVVDVYPSTHKPLYQFLFRFLTVDFFCLYANMKSIIRLLFARSSVDLNIFFFIGFGYERDSNRLGWCFVCNVSITGTFMNKTIRIRRILLTKQKEDHNVKNVEQKTYNEKWKLKNKKLIKT